tara:strand:+ start:4983 stop:5234 length:252 start_codon:yes stop_codon:yes gene_type:complete
MELLSFSHVCLVVINDVQTYRKELNMLGWALSFLIIAIIAGVLGLGGVAVIAADVAQLLFIVFIALFIVSAIVHAVRGTPPPA